MRITNDTDRTVTGEVQYLSAFCSNDDYEVAPGSTWKASSRGVCLVSGITGLAHSANPNILPNHISPYSSTGTSYSKFFVKNRPSLKIYSEAEVAALPTETTAASGSTAIATEHSLLTDGAYFWVLNGDGSRSWLRSPPPCRAQATKIARSDVDRMPKRHGGDNDAGYGLSATDAQSICDNPSGAQARLVTDGAYFWVINADGSRNWIENRSVTSGCRRNAQRISDIERYPKRHGGSGGYTLTDGDAARACSVG